MPWNSQVVEKIDTIISDEFISEVIYVSDYAMDDSAHSSKGKQ